MAETKSTFCSGCGTPGIRTTEVDGLELCLLCYVEYLFFWTERRDLSECQN